MIASELDVPSLICLGATSRDHYIRVHNYLYKRSRDQVRPYVTNPENLFAVLGWTKAIISGSTALCFMMKPSMHSNWSPGDLDIYCSRQGSASLISYFRFEGYTITRRWSDELYPSVEGIADVISITNRNKKIDIVITNATSAFYCIMRFHVTAVMNFLSADGFFSAYPTLTSRNLALASALSYYPQTDPTPIHTSCYAKYELRGYFVAHSIKDFECNYPMINYSHRCRSSPTCPHTVRSMFDRGCLFIPLVKNRKEVLLEADVYPVRTYQSRLGIVWHLGGDHCEETSTYETLRPFVTIKGT